MQMPENWVRQVQEPPASPDFPKPEPVTPPHEPVTPPGEPVTPPSEPVTPPSEPLRGRRTPDGRTAERNPDLEKKIAETHARMAELTEATLALRADMERLQRRAEEELARAEKFAVERFAEALMPVADSLEAALHVNTTSLGSYRDGVEMTLKQLAAAFTRNRLEEINPSRSEPFDPAVHRAICIMPAEQQANTVVNVLQKGYMIAGCLLRPALVTVAK